MGKLKKSQTVFSVVEALLLVVIVAILGFTGWYVFNVQQDTSKNLIPNNSTTPKFKNNSQKTNSDTNKVSSVNEDYLVIPEIGIKFKLTSSIKDAYYAIGQSNSLTGQSIVHLSTHSLDKYPGCAASQSNSGIASIGTFKESEQDEVVGDFSKAYPSAPKIDGLYYFIGADQYDCTLGKDSDLHSTVRHAFVDAYSTIQQSQ